MKRERGDSEVLTVPEAADLLRTSEFNIRRWAREGTIPAIKLKNQWRFLRQELLDWLRRQQRGGGPSRE